MQCTAKSKQSGQQCKRHAVPGGTKCKTHGGASLKGIASATYKHGGRSKYLPANLQTRYQEAVDDPELLNLRTDLALVEARLAQLLERVDTGEAGALWKAAKDAFEDLRKAGVAKDPVAQQIAFNELSDVLGRGLSDYAAWNEISSLLEQRRKLSESERRRLVDMQQMISTEQAMLFAGQVLDIIRRNVSDRATLNAIQLDFIRLMNKQPQRVELDDGAKD
jgi:hypothetical protein